jgi:hypothetical protein
MLHGLASSGELDFQNDSCDRQSCMSSDSASLRSATATFKNPNIDVNVRSNSGGKLEEKRLTSTINRV